MARDSGRLGSFDSETEVESSITFEATGVSVLLLAGAKDSGYDETNVVYALRKAKRERLVLSSGEDVFEMPVMLRIQRVDSARSGRIGSFSYFAKVDGTEGFPAIPADFLGEIYLPTSQFDELLALARLGKFPDYVSLEVDGLTGNVVDGYHWDQSDESNESLPVISIALTIQCGGDSPYRSFAR